MTTALFIGRFQPLHNGHVFAIKEILKNNEQLIIAIGSAQKNGHENPFSFSERKEMIELSVSGNYRIFPLEDMNDNNLWAQQVEKVCGKFDFVYTGNPLVAEILSSAGYSVKPVKILPCASATEIREMIADGNPEWKEFVPAPAVEFLEKNKGVERVGKIFN